MTSKITTLHINTEPTWRGGEQQTLYLLQGLQRRGHPVLLCAQKRAPLADRARHDGIETVEISMRGEADALAALKLARCVRRFRPAIVHYHTSHAHGLGALAMMFIRRNRPKTLLTRRVDFSIYRHSFFGLNHLKYNRVDRIVAISAEIQRVLLDDGVSADRIDCVPSGIDPQRFLDVPPADLHAEFSLPPETKLVGNTAYFADHKGQRYLVDACPEILKAFPNCAIFLIGDGELREPLMKRAQELGVAERVLFPGFRNDVPAILKALDLFVMPSHKEGLGTAVLDALMCGTPVVGTRAGGIPEAVHHEVNGLLVPPQDSAALSAAILRLLRDPDEVKRLAQAGPKTVAERFTTDRMVEGNLAVYRKLLGLTRSEEPQPASCEQHDTPEAN